ncbi:MAG TPA: FGGY family carbohydrate kinase [Tepidisphaeraceae bacterium]|nr:FGGY family carbohydrate kinase [Tepidisphaeraceae bacterium]
MLLLGLDIGSSSVKAGLLRDGRLVGKPVRGAFDTRYGGGRAEVEPAAIMKAVAGAVRELGDGAKRVDALALAVMSPAWVAMDKAGAPLTPIVTHQDRRSVDEARRLEARVGMARHLKLAGNRPFPGGISSTTWNWFRRHEPGRLKRADLVGHLSTFLVRTLTGARVIDPSNASFTGLYVTTTQRGWSDELCAASRVAKHLLPDLVEADQIAGTVLPAAARRFGLKAGTPVLAGMVDTSAAMLLTGAEPGQLLNVAGSTDVLAVLVDRPRPHERLLTRALGVGRRWMSVSTLAAGGSVIVWAKEQLFPELDFPSFRTLVTQLAKKPDPAGVTFDPALAGDRTSIEQCAGAFAGLTLATTRQHMLSAVLESLAAASAARLPLLDQGGRVTLRKDVVVSGGTSEMAGDLLYRDWPRRARWTFRSEDEATLRGLGTLVPRER